MTPGPQPIFEAVRRACFPATWSRGISLARADAVVGEEAGVEEAVFHVSTRGGMICPKVTLFLDDLDWDCECSSREEACEHVAAAVIAWKRAGEKGGSLPSPKHAAGRVGYRFERSAQGLTLERVVVMESDSTPLVATLAALASGRAPGPRVLATQPDLAVELALGTHRRGLLAPRLIQKIFARLARCDDITLDGRPVTVSAEPVLPRARLEDQGDGFRLRLVDDPRLTERFSNAMVLCGSTLHVAGEPGLTGREWHELSSGRFFSTDAAAELVTEVLPSLGRRIPVDVETTRLPSTERQPPRVALDVQGEDRALSVLPTLVYGDPPTARIDGGRLVHLRGAVPLRDEHAERLLRKQLRTLGLEPGVRAEFAGAEAVQFNARLEGWEGAISGRGREAFELCPALEPSLQLAGNRFDLSFESPSGDGARPRGQAAAPDVLRAWRAGESLVPLMGGGWAPLPADWLDRFGSRIADLLAARDDDGAVPRCCLPDVARLCEDLDEPPPPEVDRLRRKLDDFEGIPTAELPDDLTVELRPYQRRGVDWLVFLRDSGLGALLADDMGLGKTVQALCAVNGRTLVVAPTSVLHNWAGEAARHRPGLSCSVYHGASRELDPAAHLTLTTYSILRLDAERLAGVSWDAVVLDEAQNIKNPDSQVARAAYGLTAEFRLAMTGTPVENRLEELWSQFHFVNRGLLGGRRDFNERYSEPIARGDDDDDAAARLRARIRPFVLRRLKSEVAGDLPPRTEMVLHCELDREEREVYDAIRAATLSEVVRRLDEGGNVLAVLEALLRLRQASCHRALVPGQTAESSSKLRVLLEALSNVVADGHKALVFSQWTSLLDLTEPHLRAEGVAFLRLDGSTRNRGEVVRRFQEVDGPPVMLISLKAGGTGLNLTAADHIFLLDPWWNPAVEGQAADRAHRIGQERPVMIYRLIAEETVEERIVALQERKRDLAGAALDGADRAAGLTREDLIELLN